MSPDSLPTKPKKVSVTLTQNPTLFVTRPVLCTSECWHVSSTILANSSRASNNRKRTNLIGRKRALILRNNQANHRSRCPLPLQDSRPLKPLNQLESRLASSRMGREDRGRGRGR